MTLPRPHTLLALLLATLTLTACSPATESTSGTPSRTIDVSAAHTVQAVPDQLQVHWQIRREGDDLSQLTDEVNQVTGKLLDSIAEHGIDRDDVRSYELRMQPRYDYDQSPPVATGHRVQRQVRLTLSSAEQLQDLLDQALAVGVSELQQLQYEISDPAPYYEQALAKAMAEAKAKGRILAAASDAQLGDVVAIDEVSQGGATLDMRQLSQADTGWNAPGQQPVTARLKVRFALAAGTE